MESIPQCSPLASYHAYQTEIDDAIRDVLSGGWYILGKQVEQFETEFAAYNNSRFCVSVASGTDALILSLKALGLGPGDGVITVSHTAVATIAAVEAIGAVPVFVDIAKDDMNMDPSRLDDLLKKYGTTYEGVKLKAIIPVHIYGHPCDMKVISALADQYGLKVIEDCAQAHGASIGGRQVGNFGDLGAFSFYPTKNLGALGDGGGIVTNDESLYSKLLSLRQYGWRKRYVSEIPGYNSRLDELQAAVLRVKLGHLALETKRRQAIAGRYHEALSDVVELPVVKDQHQHVYHLFVVRSTRRDALMQYLTSRKIQTGIHYPMAVHAQPAYSDRNYVPYPLEETEHLYKLILSLPMFPELTDEEVNVVVQGVREFK